MVLALPLEEKKKPAPTIFQVAVVGEAAVAAEEGEVEAAEAAEAVEKVAVGTIAQRA